MNCGRGGQVHSEHYVVNIIRGVQNTVSCRQNRLKELSVNAMLINTSLTLYALASTPTSWSKCNNKRDLLDFPRVIKPFFTDIPNIYIYILYLNSILKNDSKPKTKETNVTKMKR